MKAAPTAYWMVFHMWVVDRLAAEEMKGTPLGDLAETTWATYVTSYWATAEMTAVYGVPPAVINLGMTVTAPSPDSVTDFVAKFKARRAALDAGGDALFRLVADLLREEPCTGMIHGNAYNAGYAEVIGEGPPLGELPAHLHAPTGSIRANPRDFLRLDYAIPAPAWLQGWRTRFEIAVRAHPDAFETIVAGRDDEKDLRALWAESLAWGHNNWGGQSLLKWSQDYYDDTLYISLVYNFGLEAISLAAFVALLEGDAATAERAIRANAVLLGSWGAAVMGLLDPAGKLPKLLPA